jgi:hypothetical protein
VSARHPGPICRRQEIPSNRTAFPVELEQGAQRKVSAAWIDAGRIAREARSIRIQELPGVSLPAELQIDLVQELMGHNQVERAEKPVFLEVGVSQRD